MRPPPTYLLAALLAAALVAADFSFDRDCAKLLPDWDKAAPPALRQQGAERQLWLAWREDADRASAALLLREVARHPRCGSLRCRLALCRVEGGLCDLLNGTAAFASASAFVAGFQPLSRMSCDLGRHVSAVGRRLAPFAWSEPALLVAEDVPLLMYAPWLLRLMRRHAPAPDALRRLHEREAAGAGGAGRSAAALEAAAVPAAAPAPEPPMSHVYRALVYVCDEDRWNESALHEMLRSLSVPLARETRPHRVLVRLEPESVRCASRSDLGVAVSGAQAGPGAHRLLGAVAAGAGAAEAARLAGARGLALVAYDAQAGDGGELAPLEAGPRARRLAEALSAALRDCGWGRAALLSAEDAASARIARLVRSPGPLRLATLSADEAALRATLRSLSAERTGAVVLNADGAGAARALRLAAEEGLAGCAWLAREWSEGAAPRRLLALRAAPRSPTEAGPAADADAAAAALKSAWPGGRWPARAAPLAEALLTLAVGFARLFEAHEELRYDHVAGDTLGLLRINFENDTTPLRGVARDLTFDARGALPRPLRLELWEANATAGRELTAAELPAACPVAGPAPRCELPVGGDEYAARLCLDPAVAVGGPALLLAALAAGYGAAALRRRRRARALASRLRLRAEAGAALLARQPHAGPALRALLVERERVTLGRALGAGRHGRVWLARLAPGAAPLAAKGPLAGAAPAEEGELLREAATLAPLRHPHVLRLLGVCVGPGPPLLLTALAPRGDLLRYLRARRPPAEGAPAAPALTRLAREAALALAYLAARGVVHRDVRAANCLLDERRALKLADFGMARRLGAGGSGPPRPVGAEYYACRRRALFPVLWMAPESLSRGAFSPASDVWSLGVLALELVTLGARPFGALGAAEAVALVTRGGHARLPGGASPETRRLARLCWRREAGSRPTAAEVAEWLAARPAALAPCPPSPDAEDEDGSSPDPAPDRPGSAFDPAGR